MALPAGNLTSLLRGLGFNVDVSIQGGILMVSGDQNALVHLRECSQDSSKLFDAYISMADPDLYMIRYLDPPQEKGAALAHFLKEVFGFSLSASMKVVRGEDRCLGIFPKAKAFDLQNQLRARGYTSEVVPMPK